MKFTFAAISAVLALASTAAASGVSRLEARAPLPNAAACTTYGNLSGVNRATKKASAACSNLSRDCNRKAKDTIYLWSKTSCVAAALCESPESVVQFNRCPGNNQVIPEQNALAALSKNIYKNIVGSCADQGCGMTQQNFTDLIYSSLSAINSNQWPEECAVESWWLAMKEWTMTGDRIPYGNFNDFLLYRSG